MQQTQVGYVEMSVSDPYPTRYKACEKPRIFGVLHPRINLMTAQATNAPIGSTFFDRLKASFQRGWSRFVIVRQMEGIRVAAQHLGDLPELKARMAALHVELSKV
jgi:hypothetical protein